MNESEFALFVFWNQTKRGRLKIRKGDFLKWASDPSQFRVGFFYRRGVVSAMRSGGCLKNACIVAHRSGEGNPKKTRLKG